MANPYDKVTIDGTFFKKSGWYLFNVPIRVPYATIAYEAQKNGYKLKKLPEECEIIESPRKFGKGWIAVEIHPTRKIDDSVMKLNEEYYSFLHKGSYKLLVDVYKKISENFDTQINFLNIYLNSPENVKSEDELMTLILWK